MTPDGPIIAASILTADFGNLQRVVRALEKAGVDRLHLDVMDGHFVPALTFGPDVAAAVRRLTRLPIDLHLMIDAPSRFVPAFLDGGADSVTFHVEAPEPAERRRAALEAIRDAGRMAGLAMSPGTPTAAHEQYADLPDIVRVV
ncbi:MAG: ribulose-phosphate 3-epimerase, partial [Candidatus Limnocylindrales bacterium]